jgi:hypothetical protein
MEYHFLVLRAIDPYDWMGEIKMGKLPLYIKGHQAHQTFTGQSRTSLKPE